jgi:hypothetical protein
MPNDHRGRNVHGGKVTDDATAAYWKRFDSPPMRHDANSYVSDDDLPGQLWYDDDDDE